MRLQKEFEMIRWYMQHQHIVQAVTLAHEWLSALAEHDATLDRQQLSTLQDQLRRLRNDLAHAGMDANRRRHTTAIQTQMQKIYQELENLQRSRMGRGKKEEKRGQHDAG